MKVEFIPLACSGISSCPSCFNAAAILLFQAWRATASVCIIHNRLLLTAFWMLAAEKSLAGAIVFARLISVGKILPACPGRWVTKRPQVLTTAIVKQLAWCWDFSKRSHPTNILTMPWTFAVICNINLLSTILHIMPSELCQLLYKQDTVLHVCLELIEEVIGLHHWLDRIQEDDSWIWCLLLIMHFHAWLYSAASWNWWSMNYGQKIHHRVLYCHFEELNLVLHEPVDGSLHRSSH